VSVKRGQQWTYNAKHDNEVVNGELADREEPAVDAGGDAEDGEKSHDRSDDQNLRTLILGGVPRVGLDERRRRRGHAGCVVACGSQRAMTRGVVGGCL